MPDTIPLGCYVIADQVQVKSFIFFKDHCAIQTWEILYLGKYFIDLWEYNGSFRSLLTNTDYSRTYVN